MRPPVLDIERFRSSPDVVRDSLQRRDLDPAAVDEVLGLDERWRDRLQALEALRAERNRVAEEIAEVKAEGGDAKARIAEMQEVNARIEELEVEVEEAKTERDRRLWELPNLLHDSVPKGATSEDNETVRRWGDAEPRPDGTSHVDLLAELDVGDIERAARAAGARFFYLKNDLVLMDLALTRFAMDHLVEQGYTPVQPPYMLRREAMEGAVDLSAFEDVLYKVEGEDLYLIATAEHPLAAMHMDEILAEDDLPLRYAGVSPCFRREAGAHGKDTKGIFRVHQFHKVEQFIFAEPEGSWDLHEELLENAEAIYQALGLPYRVVNICTGDLGAVAAKKYDLEAWFPVQGAYREVVSCSNCTDYQARRYGTRTREHPGDPTRIVHTLNATAVATQRTMVAILETYQRDDGSVEVPEVLRPYMGGREAIRPPEADDGADAGEEE